jgi:hypothetical protein
MPRAEHRRHLLKNTVVMMSLAFTNRWSCTTGSIVLPPGIGSTAADEPLGSSQAASLARMENRYLPIARTLVEAHGRTAFGKVRGLREMS